MFDDVDMNRNSDFDKSYQIKINKTKNQKIPPISKSKKKFQRRLGAQKANEEGTASRTSLNKSLKFGQFKAMMK